MSDGDTDYTKAQQTIGLKKVDGVKKPYLMKTRDEYLASASSNVHEQAILEILLDIRSLLALNLPARTKDVRGLWNL